MHSQSSVRNANFCPRFSVFHCDISTTTISIYMSSKVELHASKCLISVKKRRERSLDCIQTDFQIYTGLINLITYIKNKLENSIFIFNLFKRIYYLAFRETVSWSWMEPLGGRSRLCLYCVLSNEVKQTNQQNISPSSAIWIFQPLITFI